MRPGKLFQIERSSILFYPNERLPGRTPAPKRLPFNTIFMVLSANPEQNSWFCPGLETPWLVLVGDQIGFIDISGVRLLDVTPFPKNKSLKENEPKTR